MKPLVRTGFLVASLMFASAGLAVVMRPTNRISDQGPGIDLAIMVPKHLGSWREINNFSTQVVNPQQKEMLDRFYSQTLSRIYENESGYRIMLSIAYGGDQTDMMQVHYPESCYPAQGFRLLSSVDRPIKTAFGMIEARRLETELGPRKEPITYWMRVGDRVVLGRIEKKLAEMKFGLTRRIPDGILIRVSSIDTESSLAYSMHDAFVEQMLLSVSNESRLRLIGSIF